ncbi:hypothetical protein JD844_011373 [Phrynosoma platyrhinos]|uniref:Uncharacterized protein n=1 Tax=Phrynosoma platyrhinos TaxID=52577 RepID=A0ABQ7TI99_PHRPL|nr:hypothetical protein JD844_011373 [Phrynosoma platyrhinos]
MSFFLLCIKRSYILSVQLILWIGLGVLLISTYTTLSATQDIPAKIESVEPGKLPGEIKNVLDENPVKIADQNPAVEEVVHKHDKPILQNGKEEVEQPQIKVPMDVPNRDEKEKPKEEVQLDRPDQGFAQPVGEAHRHEPPVPHDEVVVDEGQDHEEPEENRPPDNKEFLVEENPVLGEDRAQPQPVPEQTKGDGGQEKLEYHPVKDPKPLPDLVAHKDERPPYKDLELDEQDERRDKAIGGKDGAIPQEGRKAVEEENETGEKRELLPPERPEPAQVEEREIRNAKENVDIKAEEAGQRKQLDHAVLLQVIKEQQVQQKQLLDQQAKLLAVIEEQHKEIHQQRQEEGDEDRPKQEIHQEPALPFSKSKEREDGFENEDVAKNIPNDSPDHPVHDSQHLDSDGQKRQQATGPGQQKQMHSKLTGAPPKNPAAPVKNGEKIAQHQAGKNPAVKLVDPVRSDSQIAMADGHQQEKQAKDEELKEGQDIQEAQNFQEKIKNAKNRNEVAERAEGQREMLDAAIAHGVAGRISERVVKKDKKGEVPDQQQQIDPAHKPKVAEKIQENLVVPEAMKPDKIGQKEALSLDQLGRAQSQGGKSKERMAAGTPSPQRKVELDSERELKEPEKLHESDNDHVLKLEQVRAAPRDQENAKPNRDLKLQAELDLRRRRRDLEEEGEEPGGVIIGLNPLPDVKVNDLRSALETRLNQAAEGAQQALHSRQIKQIQEVEEEV